MRLLRALGYVLLTVACFITSLYAAWMYLTHLFLAGKF